MLRLVAAQPVSVGRWLLGKLLVRYAVLLLLLGLAVLVSFGLMGVRVGGQGAGLLAAAYAFFWFMLALLVNLLGHSSSFNGVTLVAAWVLVVPALVSQGAYTLYPLPSRTVLVNQMRQVKNEATPRTEIILTQYQRDHPELAHADTSQQNPQRYWMGYYASQALIQRELTPFLERFEGQVQRQQDWTRGLRFLSPAMLLQGALHDLAGTSARHYQSYRQQVIAFAETWRSFFVPMIFRNEQMDRETMGRLPAFRYDPGQVPTHPATDSLALWLYGLGLSGVALLVYRRYAGRRMVG